MSQVLEVPAITWMVPGKCSGTPIEKESRGSRANTVGTSWVVLREKVTLLGVHFGEVALPLWGQKNKQAPFSCPFISLGAQAAAKGS